MEWCGCSVMGHSAPLDWSITAKNENCWKFDADQVPIGTDSNDFISGEDGYQVKEGMTWVLEMHLRKSR